MSNTRAICRPQAMVFSLTNCYRVGVGGGGRVQARLGSAPLNGSPSWKRHYSPSSFTAQSTSFSFVIDEVPTMFRLYRTNQRRTLTRVSNWKSEKSPYETLELERDADDEKIKTSFRKLAKYYHPDVYDGRGALDEGETAEARFIKIQAAYELLIDQEKRRQYDIDHITDPLKASAAWMEWLMKKRKAFNQRGDMAVSAWAEQQQHEMTIRARQLCRNKTDPEEERKLLAKEKAAYKEFYSTTLRRHTLVLKKRDIMRKKAEEQQKKEAIRLLAMEGLELDTDEKSSDVGHLLALEGLELDTDDEDN